MEVLRTSFAGRFSHPDITLVADTAYRGAAEWLLEYFSNQVRAGVVFRPGETVQIGWMTVKLELNANGDLELFEPEFGSLPIRWVRGAGNTIRHLTIQREVCAQSSVETAFPSMLDLGVISPGFLSDQPEFELSRDEPNENDSGWVFRELGYDGSDAQLCSLYQVASAVPAVIPFLALPPGSTVVQSGARIEIATGQGRTSSIDNDFLARLGNSAFPS